MKKLLDRLFGRKQEIKKFSSTTTDATEGSNSKADLNPHIKELLNKIKGGEVIDNEQLNQLSSFYFNTPTIEPLLYRLNPAMVKQGMLFNIEGVSTIMNADGDLDNILITMKEIVFNVEMTMNISVKDFHEIMEKVQPIRSN